MAEKQDQDDLYAAIFADEELLKNLPADKKKELEDKIKATVNSQVAKTREADLEETFLAAIINDAERSIIKKYIDKQVQAEEDKLIKKEKFFLENYEKKIVHQNKTVVDSCIQNRLVKIKEIYKHVFDAEYQRTEQRSRESEDSDTGENWHNKSVRGGKILQDRNKRYVKKNLVIDITIILSLFFILFHYFSNSYF